MVLVLSEVNCTLLKDRLKSGQNCTENQPLGTPKALISRTRLKNGRWTWNFGILHKSTWRLCVPILSKIGWPSFPSLPQSLRQKLLISKNKSETEVLKSEEENSSIYSSLLNTSIFTLARYILWRPRAKFLVIQFPWSLHLKEDQNPPIASCRLTFWTLSFSKGQCARDDWWISILSYVQRAVM